MMSATPPLVFAPSDDLSLGVELELQCMNTRDHDLSTAAPDLLRLLEKLPCPGEVKPEITQSMIELNSAVARDYPALLTNLRALRDVLVDRAQLLNVAVAGGGAHPFQQWSEQRIFAGERYQAVWHKYGYLAKQFTVFGQHIHIGVANADRAIGLLHHLSHYVPAFIALSAASPFYQNQDTLFASSRLTSINAFPLSGTMPFVTDWAAFSAYYASMKDLGIIASMKDFYWDIRPKPEYGTIEIRVCDTPLTIGRAAALAAYAQALAAQYLAAPTTPDERAYLAYRYNRFQAARYGLAGEFIDARSGAKEVLGDLICRSIDDLAPHIDRLGLAAPLRALHAAARDRRTDADLLRTIHAQTGSLTDVAAEQARLWATDSPGI